MTTSKQIRKELLKKIAQSTIYKRMKSVRKVTGNSTSKEVAIDIVASQEDIDVHTILKKENRNDELIEFRDVMSKFNFKKNDNNQKSLVTIKKDNEPKEERYLYDYPLSRFCIDAELTSDCKIQKPYRKAVSEAMLTLETRIRSTLSLPDTFTGSALITEAKKKGIFQRTVPAEEEGLYFLFMGGIKWLRNPSNHRKITYSKENSIKIVLFTDYLIGLFDDLVNKRI